MTKVTRVESGDTGVYTIYTMSGSRYVMDTTKMSIRRHSDDESDWANDLRRAAEHTVVFLRECVLGKPLVAVVETPGSASDGSVSEWFSSTVTRIIKN